MSGMKVLVCGGRVYNDRRAVERRLRELPSDTTIIHGGAQGADVLAGGVASRLGFTVRSYPADWKRHGKAAGPMRNQAMLDAECPDLVLAFPGAKGTADMVRRARAAGVPVEEVEAMREEVQSGRENVYMSSQGARADSRWGRPGTRRRSDWRLR